MVGRNNPKETQNRRQRDGGQREAKETAITALKSLQT